MPVSHHPVSMAVVLTNRMENILVTVILVLKVILGNAREVILEIKKKQKKKHLLFL